MQKKNSKTTLLVAVVMVVVLLALLAPSASAHRRYLKHFPNPSSLPCPAGVDCHGRGVCAGFGHRDCINGKETDFGEAFEDEGEAWNVKLCRADHDGDGKTNGDEMGDPCCVFNYGDTPDVTDTTKLGNPSFASVTSSPPSCLLDGVPAAPTAVTVQTGKNKALVSWTVPTTSCTCSHQLTVANPGASPAFLTTASHVRNTQNPFVMCGLPAGTLLEATVKMANLAGTGTIATKQFTTLNAVNSIDDMACTVVHASARVAAGKGNQYSPGPPVHIVVPVLLGLIMLAGGAFVRYVVTKGAPNSSLQSRFAMALVHKEVWAGRLDGMNYQQLAWALYLAICAVATSLYYKAYYDSEIYTWGGDARLARVIGRVLYVPLGFIMIPVTRHSVLVKVLGIRLDRGARFHRIVGALIVLGTILHGVLIIIAYDKSAWGAGFVLMTEPAELQSLWGTVSGVLFTILGVFSFGFVRRRFYAVFKAVHYVFPLAIFLAVIHTGDMAVWVLLAAILYGLDILYTLYHVYVSRTTVVAADRFHKDANGRYAFIRLVLDKPGFSYQAGQFAYLRVAELSWLSHPFTIASAPNAQHPGRFTLLIRSMGPATWTDALINDLDWSGKGNDLAIAAFGPCGRPTLNVHHHDHVMLVAGGVGITACSALWAEKAQQANKTGNENVELIWSFRERECAESVLPILIDKRGAIKQAFGGNDDRDDDRKNEDEGSANDGARGAANLAGFQLTLSWTKASKAAASSVHQSGKSQGDKEAIELESMEAGLGVRNVESLRQHFVDHGAAGDALTVDEKRPDLADAFKRFRERVAVSKSPEPVFVVVAACGPQAMLNSVRRLAHAMSDTNIVFLVHTESFLF
eukprot:TRINITY_DN103551_c0_g1_i1.p1 TRINITY_DN103551_c0_g1~~TRINITY_DN103551_c0_g1_i1.p1  ORF type:complete len:869 (+),score=374.64 TRINITY_DN103551_c0_g1_i1:32-2608(+)